MYHACFNILRQLASSAPKPAIADICGGPFRSQSGELAHFFMTEYVEDMRTPKHECSIKFTDTMRQGMKMKMGQEKRLYQMGAMNAPKPDKDWCRVTTKLNAERPEHTDPIYKDAPCWGSLGRGMVLIKRVCIWFQFTASV